MVPKLENSFNHGTLTIGGSITVWLVSSLTGFWFSTFLQHTIFLLFFDHFQSSQIGDGSFNDTSPRWYKVPVMVTMASVLWQQAFYNIGFDKNFPSPLLGFVSWLFFNFPSSNFGLDILLTFVSIRGSKIRKFHAKSWSFQKSKIGCTIGYCKGCVGFQKIIGIQNSINQSQCS